MNDVIPYSVVILRDALNVKCVVYLPSSSYKYQCEFLYDDYEKSFISKELLFGLNDVFNKEIIKEISKLGNIIIPIK